MRQTGRVGVLDHRKSRRFKVAWEVIVRGADNAGLRFEEAGRLDNLSSGGALLQLARPLPIGLTLDVWIKVPFRRENWLCYRAEVVRVDALLPHPGVAIKFDNARPKFDSR